METMTEKTMTMEKAAEAQEREPVVEIRHVSKYFGKRKVVSDLTMTTYAGEVFGFLGPNGGGQYYRVYS